MAKGGKSKTDVSARQQLKNQVLTCRYCGRKPEVVKVLTTGGKAQMYRKCCVAAGVSPSL